MRILLGSLYIFIFTFLIYKVEGEFINRDIFKVKDITIYGNSELLKEELKKMGNSFYNKNIFYVNLDSIEKKIKTDVRVKKVKVISEGIGKIKIDVEEKQPKFYVNIDEKIYSVDSEGQIFAQMEEHKIKSLPIIFIQKEEELSKAVKILDNIDDDELYNMVSQIYYKNDIDVELLIGEKTLLKTNLEVPVFKYNLAKDLYKDLSQNQNVEYMDLRFDGYIVKNTGVGANGR